MEDSDRIVYSLNIQDIQDVASETLGRVLTDEEISIVEEHLGDSIKWYDIIESVIGYYIGT